MQRRQGRFQNRSRGGDEVPRYRSCKKRTVGHRAGGLTAGHPAAGGKEGSQDHLTIPGFRQLAHRQGTEDGNGKDKAQHVLHLKTSIDPLEEEVKAAKGLFFRGYSWGGGA